MRFETAPGEQAQMDWGHFGNWGGKRLYGFAMTLCWSRMRYVEFTQRQDAETLINCMVHAFEFFGGVKRREEAELHAWLKREFEKAELVANDETKSPKERDAAERTMRQLGPQNS